MDNLDRLIVSFSETDHQRWIDKLMSDLYVVDRGFLRFVDFIVHYQLCQKVLALYECHSKRHTSSRSGSKRQEDAAVVIVGLLLHKTFWFEEMSVMPMLRAVLQTENVDCNHISGLDMQVLDLNRTLCLTEQIVDDRVLSLRFFEYGVQKWRLFACLVVHLFVWISFDNLLVEPFLVFRVLH